MVGDLVHIPSGVVLYEDSSGIWPLEITKAPSVGLVSKHATILGIYEIYSNGNIYHIRKEDIFLLTRKA